jgi:iron complex transport system ATP-binding protein
VTTRLTVRNVSWNADATPIVSNVSIDAGTGELIALMGRNGAGKSTLLDLVAGLRSPAGGDVLLDGRSLRAWPARERAKLVAHLPQAVRPDLPFPAGEIVLMGRYPHTDQWFETEADRQAVERAMRRTACWDVRDRLVRTLSGGERQRVLLAACVAQEPEIWLLDEPTTYLDIDQQIHCFATLREECDRGSTCLAVTHDVNLALTYATRIVVMEQGRIAVDVPVAEAAHMPEWLAHVSAHLALSVTSTGRPWAIYS